MSLRWIAMCVALVACSGSSASVDSSDGGTQHDDASGDDNGDDAGAGDDASPGDDASTDASHDASHDASAQPDASAHDASQPDSSHCTPFCGSMVCGDDGCGGSCGSCPSSYTCVINGTCQKDPGSQCGNATCGSAASCCHCNGQPICFALPPGSTCATLGSGCN